MASDETTVETVGADPKKGTADPGRWEHRPLLAFVVSALVVLIPAGIGFVVGMTANLLIPQAHSLGEAVARFAFVGILSGVAAWAVEHQTRRLAPVAVLLRMSLVFPDQAPSRFSVAMRSGALSKMQARLVEQDLSNPDSATMSEIAAEMVALVSALRSHDRRTRGHSERVRAYADLLGEEMGLSAEDRQKLQWGALLHDVGKMAVPAAILNKPGKPDPEEWAILQNHPNAAKALLEPLSGWLGPWAAAAWEHHERWDGNGYPNRLSGPEITLSGRIVAVADAFEVMTAVRSYKKSMPAAQARAELARCSGSHFDPQVVRAMMAVSVRRLSVVSGPLSWLSQLPFFGWTTSPGGLSVVAMSAGRSAILASAVSAGAVGAVAATAGTAPNTQPAHTVEVQLATSRFGPTFEAEPVETAHYSPQTAPSTTVAATKEPTTTTTTSPPTTTAPAVGPYTVPTGGSQVSSFADNTTIPAASNEAYGSTPTTPPTTTAASPTTTTTPTTATATTAPTTTASSTSTAASSSTATSSGSAVSSAVHAAAQAAKSSGGSVGAAVSAAAHSAER